MTDTVAAARVADHPIDARFTARWSPRAFAAAPVSVAQVMTVLEAARWAPSASNNQPWRFVWALRGEEGFARILGSLVSFNQDWAGKAGALIVVASKTVNSRDDGTETPNEWHAFDAGAAWGALALQAHLSGLAAHAMGGFDKARAAEAVALPAHHVIHAVVALGVQGDAADLPEKLRAREAPNGRKLLAEFTWHARFRG